MFEVDKVRNEIINIIERFPFETGGTLNPVYKNKDCVYFRDAEGKDVSFSSYQYENENGWELFASPDMLVNPVCIVGRWVHEFHPELKTDEKFNRVLFKNSIIGTSPEAREVLGDDVQSFLSHVQSQQDQDGMVWGDITLDDEFA